MGLKALLKYERKQGAVSDEGDRDFANSFSEYKARPCKCCMMLGFC